MKVHLRQACEGTWHLLDPQQRLLGRIIRTRRGLFVEPDDGSLAGIGAGPFATLATAVSAIDSIGQGASHPPSVDRAARGA